MRQAGILAAAGIYALKHHVERLAVDHEHARLLASALGELGFGVEPVETNIVIFTVERKDLGVPELQERLRRHGVLASPAGGNPRKMRLVTHLDVTRPDIDQAIAALRSAAKETQIPLPPERGASSP